MRARDFLIEYSREKTANVFGNKLIAALAKDKSYMIQQQGTEQGLGKARAFLDQKAKIGSEITAEQRQYILDLIMHVLENADPTQNKEYVQWLAKVYANQGIKIEDILARGQNALEVYNTYKLKKILPPEYRDIGRLSFNDLENLTDSSELRQAFDAKQEQDRAKTMPRGDSTVYYDDSTIRVLIPNDQDAACFYGQGTRWCTAAQNNNMYKTYSKQGPLYIILPKKPTDANDKYQFHFESGQYMDASDNQIDLDKIVERYPSLRLAFAEQGIEYYLLPLMAEADAEELQAQSSELLNSNGVVKHPGGILTINLNNWQAEGHVSLFRGVAVQLLTGENIDAAEGDADGGIAYAIVDPAKKLVKIMLTVESLYGPAVLSSLSDDTYETFGGFNQIKKESPAMYKVAEQLEQILEKYKALVDNEELEPGSEEDTQYLSANIYNKFGYPEV